jgi:uncharacterized protein YozE (UPF0346 family)
MTFPEWLSHHERQDDQIGDLACDVKDDRSRPASLTTYAEWRAYLRMRGACPEALRTLKSAWNAYEEGGLT